MIEVHKRDGESSEALLRRFSRKVQQSGLLIRTKKNQFHQRQKSKDLRRKEAVQRGKIRDKVEYLKKVGKIDDTPQGKSFSSRRR